MAQFVGLPVWNHIVNGSDGPQTVAFVLPGVWLEALILQESNGDQMAVRYEGHQDKTPDGDTPNMDDGLFEDDRSYGLMQVMGYNARKYCGVPMGTKMNFSFLLRPLANMAFGLRLLGENLVDTGGDVSTALARYNGGFTGNPVGGPLRTQAYVDAVARHAKNVQLARGL